MIAIIPARGGSKGLPGKNIKLLNGVPLINYTISTALQATSVSRVIVTTDDQEIADTARRCGAEVPFLRPDDLATDSSMAMDVYLYTVSQLEILENSKIDSFVALLPTVPLRSANDIDEAIEVFHKKSADSVISVTEASTPIEWYRKIKENGLLTAYYPHFDAVKNRQDFEKSYVPNGAIYIFKTERLRTTREYYMENTYPFIMPRERSVDIDTQLDFEWAEFLLKKSIIK